MYQVTKTYASSLGLSACFRQWRAKSHCRFLHGYALEVKLTFQSKSLNDMNWVIDFGSLKRIKEFLVEHFDHKTVVAADDPELDRFQRMHEDELIDMVVIPFVGCEGFAKFIFEHAEGILEAVNNRGGLQGGTHNGVFLKSVEVREHPANSAIYYGE